METRDRKTELVSFRATPRFKKAIVQAANSLDKSMASFMHDALWDRLDMMEMLPDDR